MSASSAVQSPRRLMVSSAQLSAAAAVPSPASRSGAHGNRAPTASVVAALWQSACLSLFVLFVCSSLLIILFPSSPPLRAEAAHGGGGGGGVGSAARGSPSSSSGLSGQTFTSAQKLALRETVREMFFHGYNAYMRHAHPHDELKPLSRSWTDSLAELGNAPPPQRRKGGGGGRDDDVYSGVALTQIDSLSTLAVLGESAEFERAVRWIASHVHFDHDVRINLFEANIRILGGLLSAHMLAEDKSLDLYPDYDGALLPLAKDLADRFLPAFVNVRVHDDDDDDDEDGSGKQSSKPAQLPYAWVNLRHGVLKGETSEQCTAGIGTLLLEFGMLSALTNDTTYYDVAERSLFALWARRDRRTNLLGNSLSCLTGAWHNTNAGIGAGVDSFYEYLFKSYVLFGNVKWLHMFQQAEEAVERHLRWDRDFFVEADMRTGTHTHVQFNSLAAFWPGLQSLYGELSSAVATHSRHFGLWSRFDALPERVLLGGGGGPHASYMPHSTERHYILRPELMESTYLLYRRTRNPELLEMGAKMIDSLQKYARVPNGGGFAGLANVDAKEHKEDRMHSFFLAETLKYLYLLFDEDNFVHKPRMDLHASNDGDATGSASATPQIPNYVFTTEGHPMKVRTDVHMRFGDIPASFARAAGAGTAGADISTAASSSPKESARSLDSSLFLNRYSVFATPSHRMNSDTRRFLRQARPQGGVEFFRRLQAQAHSKPVALHHRGLAGEDPSAGMMQLTEFLRLHYAFVLRRRLSSQCIPDEGSSLSPSSTGPPVRRLQPVHLGGDLAVQVGEGAFGLWHAPSGEMLTIHHLGTHLVAIINLLPLGPPSSSSSSSSSASGGAHIPRPPVAVDERPVLLRPVVLEQSGRTSAWKVVTNTYESGNSGGSDIGSSAMMRDERRRYDAQCAREWDALGPFFGPSPSPLRRSAPPVGAEGGDDTGEWDDELEESAALASLQRFSSYNTTTFLTAPVVLAHPRDGCTVASSDDGSDASSSLSPYSGRIVVLRRGSCSFMDKLVRMQEAGAAGVIVINDVEATSPSSNSGGGGTSGSFVNPLPLLMMGTDSSGRSVHIPSVMVPHRYGEELLSCMAWHERLQERERERAAKKTDRDNGGSADNTWTRQEFRVELLKYFLPASSVPASSVDSLATATAAAVEGGGLMGSGGSSSSTSWSPSTSSSAALHPRVVGTLDHFVVTSMGGFTVEVTESKEGKFMLKVY